MEFRDDAHVRSGIRGVLRPDRVPLWACGVREEHHHSAWVLLACLGLGIAVAALAPLLGGLL